MAIIKCAFCPGSVFILIDPSDNAILVLDVYVSRRTSIFTSFP